MHRNIDPDVLSISACLTHPWVALLHIIHARDPKAGKDTWDGVPSEPKEMREERITTRCNNMDDLLSIPDVDY